MNTSPCKMTQLWTENLRTDYNVPVPQRTCWGKCVGDKIQTERAGSSRVNEGALYNSQPHPVEGGGTRECCIVQTTINVLSRCFVRHSLP